LVYMAEICNKNGMFSWFGIEMPLVGRLQLIKNVGFTSTSLWFGKEEALVREGHEHLMPEMVRDCGLYLENIHVPFRGCNRIWSDDASIREKVTEEYMSYILFCSRHDIPFMVMHIGRSGDVPGLNDFGLDVVRKITGYAEESGVTIAIENTRKLYQLDYIFSNIESHALGFCYDSSHDFTCSAAPATLLKKWGHLLAVTHFSDNDGLSDKHWLLGEGVINWEALKANFPVNTYSGILTLEVVPKIKEQKSAQHFVGIAFKKAMWLRSFLEDD